MVASFLRSSFALWAAASLVVGCASAPAPAAPKSFNAQSCVERSLRRTADPSMLPLAFSEFTKACAEGEQSACSSLGVMHELGLGTAEDPARAVALYQGACAAKNIGGCTNLGLAHLHGIGLPNDPRRARELLEWSCSHDHPVGCRELGSVFLLGEGVESNPTEAAKYYRLACKLADGEACYNLGAMYEQGHALEQDNAQALGFFEQACVQGDGRACDGVDRIHKLSAAANHERDAKKPMPSEENCAAGQMAECRATGLAYFRGDSVKRDVTKAVELLGRACKGADATSCSLLAPMLQGSCTRGNQESCAALKKLEAEGATTTVSVEAGAP